MPPDTSATQRPTSGASSMEMEGERAHNRILANALDICIRKSHSNITRLADHPSAWGQAKDGRYWQDDTDFFSIGNWTTSFHTGMALLAWRETEDEHFLQQVLRLEPLYHQKVHEHAVATMHDLGFLYSLYSVALFELTGNRRHRETGLKAAEVLAGRFIPAGDYIQAWGRMDGSEPHFKGLAIIDCMMNLPLLFWAAEETGDSRLREIAIRHADTTMKHFVRADGSVNHSFRFDPKTGAPIGADNYCGHSVESHWARGTAWAIYGFALAHRHTGDRRYSDVSARLARKFIAKLDQEDMPAWDFRLPVGAPRIRDSSAAAITVCGLQELTRLGSDDDLFPATKTRLLNRLCDGTYLDAQDTCPGVLKNAQAGYSGDVAISAYTSWGDYFFMEALSRELGTDETFW